MSNLIPLNMSSIFSLELLNELQNINYVTFKRCCLSCFSIDSWPEKYIFVYKLLSNCACVRKVMSNAPMTNIVKECLIHNQHTSNHVLDTLKYRK